MRRAAKARRARIPPVFERGATPAPRMQRSSNAARLSPRAARPGTASRQPSEAAGPESRRTGPPGATRRARGRAPGWRARPRRARSWRLSCQPACPHVAAGEAIWRAGQRNGDSACGLWCASLAFHLRQRPASGDRPDPPGADVAVLPEMTCSRPSGCVGACPSNSMGRVPSAVPAAARRRDAGNAGVHCRGAATPQMPARRRNPKGAWGLRASSSFLVVGDAAGIALLLAPRSHLASPMRATHAITRTGS